MAGRTPRIGDDLRRTCAAGGAQALLLTLALTGAAPADVTLTLGPDTVDRYSGRVYLAAAQGRREPRRGNWWFDPNPLFHVDVTDWTPGTPLVLGADTPGHPIKRLGDLPAGTWSLQAVIRTAPRTADPMGGEGTVLSLPVRTLVEGTPAASLTLDRVDPPRPAVPPGKEMEIVEVTSPLLSAHLGTPFSLRALVRVPQNADQPLPTLYIIGGFPGSLRSGAMIPWLFGSHPEASHLAMVYLEAEHRGGHSAFVDSEAGGPWGTALVTELIPALEARFPLRSSAEARYLTGHSSGGWTSLWLALEYPEIFGGTVSTAPDPVDFSRFQTVDIYASGANLYRNVDGGRAAVARKGDDVRAWTDDFVAMETALGEGGQMRSFEWTFSPRGPDGLPVKLWNRDTGDIDPEVAEHWRHFDITDRVQRQWDALEPVLRDHVLIVMGEQDTFHLDGAARRLDAVLSRRGLPDVVELVPGDHGSILTKDLTRRIMQRALRRARGAETKSERTHSPP